MSDLVHISSRGYCVCISRASLSRPADLYAGERYNIIIFITLPLLLVLLSVFADAFLPASLTTVLRLLRSSRFARNIAPTAPDEHCSGQRDHRKFRPFPVRFPLGPPSPNTCLLLSSGSRPTRTGYDVIHCEC